MGGILLSGRVYNVLLGKVLNGKTGAKIASRLVMIEACARVMKNELYKTLQKEMKEQNNKINSNLIKPNIMIIKINTPRTAIITSYKRPVLYKNHILLNGAVVIKFV